MADQGSRPAPALIVGSAFATQYYNVLYQQPQDVYRFYTEESRLIRAEGAGADVESITSMKDISSLFASVHPGDVRVELQSLDSQDSLNGGVLVLASGRMWGSTGQHPEIASSTGPRSFVQSFFLAPQESGFFVLNDVCRFLEEKEEKELLNEMDSQQVKEAVPVDVTAVGGAGSLQQEPSPADGLYDHVDREVGIDEASQAKPHGVIGARFPDPSAAAMPNQEGAPAPADSSSAAIVAGFTAPAPQQQPEASPAAPVKPAPPVAPAPATAPPPSAAPADTAALSEAAAALDDNGQKKSYASILQALRAGSSVPREDTYHHQQQGAEGVVTDVGQLISSAGAAAAAGGVHFGQRAPAATNRAPIVAGHTEEATAAGAAPGPSSQDSARGLSAPNLSVYVRNLPATIRADEIVALFQTFGPVKADTIQIRTNKNANPETVFAFVDFEEESGFQAAIQKQTLTVGQFVARIEEKRPSTGVRVGGRRGGRGAGGGVDGGRGYRGGDGVSGGRAAGGRVARGGAPGGRGATGGRGGAGGWVAVSSGFSTPVAGAAAGGGDGNGAGEGGGGGGRGRGRRGGRGGRIPANSAPSGAE